MEGEVLDFGEAIRLRRFRGKEDRPRGVCGVGGERGIKKTAK